MGTFKIFQSYSLKGCDKRRTYKSELIRVAVLFINRFKKKSGNVMQKETEMTSKLAVLTTEILLNNPQQRVYYDKRRSPGN